MVAVGFTSLARADSVVARRAGGRRFRERRSLHSRTAADSTWSRAPDRPLLRIFATMTRSVALSEASSSLVGFLGWRASVVKSDLPSTTKHVLLTLSLYASDLGEGIFPSVRSLVSDTSLSRKTVEKHLRLAASLGWIRKLPRHTETGRRTSNAYELRVPGQKRGTLESLTGGTLEPATGVPPGTCYRGLEEESRKNSPEEESTSVQTDLLGEPIENGGRKPSVDAAEFDKLWTLARTGSKKKAREIYAKAIREGVGASEIFAARERYVRYAEREGFRPAALYRWIRDERWDEEIPEPAEEEKGFAEREVERLEREGVL